MLRAAGAFDGINATAHHSFLGAISHRRFLGNEPLFEQTDDVLIKGDHAEGIGGFHDAVKCLAFRLTIQNQVFDSQVGSQNFKSRHTAAPDFGQQALRYDPAHGVGQADTDLLCIFGGKHPQQASVNQMRAVSKSQ